MNTSTTRARLGTCLIGLALGVGAMAAAPATSESSRQGADYDLTLSLGDSDAIAGDAFAGANPGHFAGSDDTYPCGADPVATCRTILVEVTNPFGDDATKGRERATLLVDIDGQGVGDAALKIYEADADGTRGAEASGSDELGTMAVESASVVVTTTQDTETRYYLVEVFFHAYAGSWSLDASFS
ncbi:MAG: hypothetical protein ACI867_002309 [Glaciecola sp.]|jgi:hypothetical protein